MKKLKKGTTVDVKTHGKFYVGEKGKLSGKTLNTYMDCIEEHLLIIKNNGLNNFTGLVTDDSNWIEPDSYKML